MLSITPEAAEAIQTLLSDRPEAGLRISMGSSATEGETELALALAEDPAPTDEVVASHGSKVFLESEIAPLLADKTLDVRLPSGGRGIAFRLIA